MVPDGNSLVSEQCQVLSLLSHQNAVSGPNLGDSRSLSSYYCAPTAEWLVGTDRGQFIILSLSLQPLSVSLQAAWHEME